MSNNENWTLLERLTNDEFLELLPHLSLEHSVLTQVYIPKKKWIHVLDANMQTLLVKCGVCHKHIRFEDIRSHLILNEHLLALRSKNVKQFYHPFYTYGKRDIKLAKGEFVSQNKRERALCEVNTQIIKSFKKEFMEASKFVTAVDRRLNEVEIDKIIETALDKRIENPNEMIVKVCLPSENMSKLLFCINEGEWQQVVEHNNVKKYNFFCKMCSMNCCGIGNLNAHLNGITHRLRQLEILALRYEDSSKVNQNCCVSFGNSFSFSVKEYSKHSHQKQVENNSTENCAKLSNDIASKVKALNESRSKILTFAKDRGDLSSDRNEKIQESKILGHIGVEYVLKIIKNENDPDPRFECGLCEFVGDAKKMQRHLLYYEHKKKYLDLHYSDTIKKYESLIGNMTFREFRAVMGEIIDQLAIEIEKQHGRSLPYTVSLKDYKTKRPDLIAEAYALLHASQKRGPSFSTVFSKDDIRNLKNSAKQVADSKTFKSIEYIIFTEISKEMVYLNQMSHDPVVRLRDYNAKMNKTQLTRSSRSISPTQNQVHDPMGRGGSHNDRAYSQRSRSRSPIPRFLRSPTHKHGAIVTSSNSLNQNIWDIYRREIANAATEIEIAYENYRKNPESHPLYEEEWNNFWQHRKKELEREGFNHRTHNFQPEWVIFFKQRIESLFGEELHKSQINIRHRLDIPLDAEEDCNQYDADHDMVQRPDVAEEFGRRKRHGSSDFKGHAPQNKRLYSEQSQIERKYPNSDESQMIVNRLSDNHSNVVHVLRLMTALEEHLGSLGGKVMDLLSNALQLEKNFPGKKVDFESKILTFSNCQLIETAMEKLKGILFAGLLDQKKISGFNRVIQYTADLLKYAEKMGWSQEKPVPERNKIYENDQERANSYRNRSTNNQMPNEKALSDTLMDFVNTPQSKNQVFEMTKKQFVGLEEQQSMLPDCPPPPNINTPNIDTNFFGIYKGQQASSGLAAFNTKLSLDETNLTQKMRQNQFVRSEFGKVHKNSSNSGNILYNSTFKSNNETRTNINSHNNGASFGGGVNTSSGSGPKFKNSQFIPNMDQNNVMYPGGVGGNRNQNWPRWNNKN